MSWPFRSAMVRATLSNCRLLRVVSLRCSITRSHSVSPSALNWPWRCRSAAVSERLLQRLGFQPAFVDEPYSPARAPAMESVFWDVGWRLGKSEFALMIDGLIATADQSDQREGLRAIASSAVVGSMYNDSPVRGHHASHMDKDSSRPLRSSPLETPWSTAFG